MNAAEMVAQAIRRPGETVKNFNAMAYFDGQELKFRAGGTTIGIFDVSRKALVEFTINCKADANALNGVCEALGCSHEYSFSYSGSEGYVSISEQGVLVGVHTSGSTIK